jgi:hypothetical protein
VGKSGNLIPPIVPILGYGEDLTLMECAQAERAGCDRVITRKALEHNPRWQVSLHARPEFEEARAKALPAGVEEGIRLFNAHKFHDSHDEIEAVWHKEPGGVRVLYQGILQAGIVYYFLEKQNATVALRMSRIARLKLRHFLPAFQGIDLDPLYHDLLRTEEKVRNLATRGPVKFPMADVPRIQIFSGKDSQMKKKGK